MEICFCNKRGTEKLCLKVDAEDIYSLTDTEVKAITDIIYLNDGYTWKPVGTGHALKHNLPLVCTDMGKIIM